MTLRLVRVDNVLTVCLTRKKYLTIKLRRGNGASLALTMIRVDSDLLARYNCYLIKVPTLVWIPTEIVA